MSYWMFIVMYDWFPSSWMAMVKAGIAAEHYPPDWPGETRNFGALSKLRPGDHIVAAFKGHRFAGYATLTSGLYRGGASLNVPCDDGYFEFAERFDVDWTIIPPEHDPPFIRCDDLKEKGLHIDLQRGQCVKEIDCGTFTELKLRLDKAGARKPAF